MNEAEEALVARTILKAEVDGFGIRLVLDNGTMFDYDASDGGCSLWEITKEDEIRDLPSAVKHGEWIATHERTLFSNPDSITYVCSECGYTIYGIPSTTTYCPSCGARMEGDTDETD